MAATLIGLQLRVHAGYRSLAGPTKYDATKVEGAKILMQWGAEKTFVLLGHSEEMARQMVAVFEMLGGWNFFVKKAMDK